MILKLEEKVLGVFRHILSLNRCTQTKYACALQS